MVSHNIEQIPEQPCQLFLVQTTFLQAVVDYKSYKFYKYSCKILRYYILKGIGAGSGGPPNMTSKTLLRHFKITYRYCRQRQVVIKMLTICK